MNAAFESSGIAQRRSRIRPLFLILNSSPESSSPQRSNQQAKRDMIQYLYEPPPPSTIETSLTSPDAYDIPIVPVLDDDTLQLVHTIVKAADGRKAENIVALYVAHITTLTSVLVVVSGNSRPQNQAICAAIRSAVPNSTGMTEGTAESGWMILDYGSVMVHVMTPKSRLFYNVEGKWKHRVPRLEDPTVTSTAIPLDVSEVLIPNSVAATRNNEAAAPQRKEDEEAVDPFWS
jgi:ribosome-associated protein